jgi:hypothetical protein
MTELTSLRLNESRNLEFSMEASGITDKSLDIRFIIEGADFNIMCECFEVNGVITVKIPKLSRIVQPGVYKSRLEIIADGRCFVPLVENIKFESAVNISVMPKQSNDNKKIDVKNITLNDYVNQVEKNKIDKSQKMSEIYEKIVEAQNKLLQIKKTI